MRITCSLIYGSDIDWTGGLLAHCWGTFDGIAEHWYESPGRHFDIERAKSLPPDAPRRRCVCEV